MISSSKKWTLAQTAATLWYEKCHFNGGCKIMTEEHDRLMAWQPGMPGYSHDDMILAVGLQSRKKQFPVTDVLEWIGPPHKSAGNAIAGCLAYPWSDADADTCPVFTVANGKVIKFGTVSRFWNNSWRTEHKEGEKAQFNMLDEMDPFSEAAFK